MTNQTLIAGSPGLSFDHKTMLPALRSQRNGFTVAELLVVVVLATIMAAVSLPAMSNILRQSRRDAATREFVGDLREARTQATMSGWEYAVVGFAATANGTRKNQYRMIGRRTNTQAWPADNQAPFRSANQYAGVWVDVPAMQPGIRLVPSAVDGSSRFALAFNSRGAAAAGSGSFDPFLVVTTDGVSREIRISAIGGISVQ
jgi:Tfp pilus assembly protein FimT